MSADDVYRTEMDESHDFDDAAAEALIAGAGRPADADLADVVADLRMAYGTKPPPVGAELAAILPRPAAGARRDTRSRVSNTSGVACQVRCGGRRCRRHSERARGRGRPARSDARRDGQDRGRRVFAPHRSSKTGGARGRREHDNDVGAGLEHADDGGGWCPRDSDIGQRSEPRPGRRSEPRPGRRSDGACPNERRLRTRSRGHRRGLGRQVERQRVPGDDHNRRDDVDDNAFRRAAAPRELERERKRKRLRARSRRRRREDQAPAEPGQAQGERFRQRPLTHAKSS